MTGGVPRGMVGTRRQPLSVLDVAATLDAGPLAGLRLGILHGRLHPEEKDRVMREFAAGDIDVLVATTVIEVGVDVPNATAMVIMDAERFGVSQLHQLRGRVGRGTAAGLCLLVTEAPPASPARERLDAVAATLDGFQLSRLDLEQRREGDVLGAAQAGRRSSLRLLRLLPDEDLIGQARRGRHGRGGRRPGPGRPPRAARRHRRPARRPGRVPGQDLTRPPRLAQAATSPERDRAHAVGPRVRRAQCQACTASGVHTCNVARVIAGEAGGRRLAVPAGRDTRPTSDRAREGLFATVVSIMGSLAGTRVLDLYAGSGAVGLEALSRGAAHVLLVESGDRASRVIRAEHRGHRPARGRGQHRPGGPGAGPRPVRRPLRPGLRRSALRAGGR